MSSWTATTTTGSPVTATGTDPHPEGETGRQLVHTSCPRRDGPAAGHLAHLPTTVIHPVPDPDVRLDPMATQTAPPTTRRRKMPGQMRLLAASVMMLVGAFLPWLYTPLGTVTGMRGPGLWTATVAMLALAGAIVPVRVLAMLQAVAAAAICLALPVWQFFRIFNLVGMQGWTPGPGLILTFAGGVLAAVAAWQLGSHRRGDGPPSARA